MRKKHAIVNVDKEVLDEFRKAVVQKYGRLWGCLGPEVEKALKLRLEQLRAENAQKEVKEK